MDAEKRDVALVLASGGAKGFAHIGAIEELEARGYRITSIAGTSMGALIGGLYAAGGMDVVKEWLYRLDRNKIWALLDFTWSLNAMVKGDRVMEALREMVPDCRIEDLRIPYCAVATDLKTGLEVDIDSGSLYAAIRASISLPMLLRQVESQGRLLIDGGLVNGLPLNRVARHDGDMLVAVNLDDYGWGQTTHIKRAPLMSRAYFMERLRAGIDFFSNNHLSVVYRSLLIAMKQNMSLSLQLNPPDLYVNVSMEGGYDSYDFNSAREIARLGRMQMHKSLDAFENQKV